jgi:hypothetical protein
MDNKALDAANKIKADLAAKENDVEDQKQGIEFYEKNEIVPLGTKGAVDPSAIGLRTPRSFNLPQGMGIRPRSVSEMEAKLAFEGKKHADELASKKATADNGNKLTGQIAEDIGNLKTVSSSITDLGKDWDALASQTGSSIGQFIPGASANQYNDKARVAVQNIGYALEGGKMTDSDRDFYGQMTPKATDNVAQKDAKILALKQYAKKKWDGKMSALKEGGFNVANIEQPDFGLNDDSEPTFEEAMAERLKRQKTGTAQK